MSPIFFLIYFLRGSQSIRSCKECEREFSLPKNERKDDCKICGYPITYADDLNAVMSHSRFDKEYISNKVSNQGNKIEKALRELMLAMNTLKTQLLFCMNSQRRRPSCLTVDERQSRASKLEAKIGDQMVVETDSLKTLGITFDSRLGFASH